MISTCSMHYTSKRKSEDVFAAVFLSNAAALAPNTHSGIIKDTLILVMSVQFCYQKKYYV